MFKKQKTTKPGTPVTGTGPINKLVTTNPLINPEKPNTKTLAQLLINNPIIGKKYFFFFKPIL
jgi:hypothetical protein